MNSAIVEGGYDRQKETYWYKQWIRECALCGYTQKYKWREFTPKPDDPNQRIEFEQTACSEHFL